MKKTACTALFAGMVMIAGCGPKTQMQDYAHFGAPIKADTAMTLSEAVAKADQFSGKDVCVKAKIEDVCSHMGCWMLLKDGPNQVRVRFTASKNCADGFYVPRNSAGHDAYVFGKIQQAEVTEAEARHYASDAGKPTEEVEKIVGPQKGYAMLASGVMISEGSMLDPPVEKAAH